ncbi:naDP-specific glutamate dehydrogenase [Cardiosporidium cionae]|uniref:glutamate dehydrogenase (NADP(+)) n=1 Tax=Cardiosporidium cionae TaxID=476202 RepID=A0ABQ7JBF0_9APIC|nr:naDP-specific glutamate dehydrogenase [Cardiosporidium cionae]|eukprot:KAF8821284.1 naDP-specific glutamate dehydrogenase [Cardiosporidium cionae]
MPNFALSKYCWRILSLSYVALLCCMQLETIAGHVPRYSNPSTAWISSGVTRTLRKPHSIFTGQNLLSNSIQPSKSSIMASPIAVHKDTTAVKEDLHTSIVAPHNCDSTGRFCWKPLAGLDQQMESLYASITARDPHQTKFLQAFREMLESLRPVFLKDSKYLPILAVIAEPERSYSFRVPWLDDKHQQHVNRGYRVQYSSALGPYKGGLRFHPSVTMSVMKFLGFEQIFKNSLTGLTLGGAKGGADFDIKGKSDAEVLRFCQSFMISLARHIGHNEDIPAGDIGVGPREIGYLYGQYKRMTSQFEGCLTGKNVKWGGSYVRPESTGYGVVYFANEVLKCLVNRLKQPLYRSVCGKDSQGKTLEGSRCVVSGSGNVAQHCAAKLLAMGAKVITLSDSTGFIYEEKGFTPSKLETLMHIKNVKRKSLREYEKASKTATFISKEKPWNIACDYAFPCANENDIDETHADTLIKQDCKMVVEGANMPLTNEAISLFKQNDVTLCPAKAANSGGVTVSGFEMAQNSMRLYWTFDDVDKQLQAHMKDVFLRCKNAAEEYDSPLDLQLGANAAGFIKVADSLVEQGCV